MIIDLQLAPADDARLEIAKIGANIEKYLQSRENGISRSDASDLKSYLDRAYKNLVLERAEITKHNAIVEFEVGYVKVKLYLEL